mmetsp:Transcript_21575/g.53363  ORF Transcript_21575/g.53363 Transcript_21575/m.53363 type:complete len:117 (-) Transcript_21575:206-556(-)
MFMWTVLDLIWPRFTSTSKTWSKFRSSSWSNPLAFSVFVGCIPNIQKGILVYQLDSKASSFEQAHSRMFTAMATVVPYDLLIFPVDIEPKTTIFSTTRHQLPSIVQLAATLFSGEG